MEKDLIVELVRTAPDFSELEKGFLQRLIQLLGGCFKSRNQEIAYRIQWGRDLANLHAHCKDVPKLFAWCMEQLEISERTAYHRVAISATWDVIERHIETNHLSTPPPSIESHLQELFSIPLLERGRAWETFHQHRDTGSYYNANDVAAFVQNYKALPAPSEIVSSTDGDQDEFDYAPSPTPVAEVPRGTKEAQAHVAEPGSAPGFVRPDGVRAAIERIAFLCGTGWGEALNRDDKVSNEDVLSWASEKNDEHVKEIARMIGGDHKAGIRRAIKIIHKLVDDNTRIWELKHLVFGAEDGKYVYESLDHIRITVTDLNIRQK